ncbi:helix-turn-helix transcriptional regulator [Gordonia sp. CPCC 205333]|uniref:helix-turn-helix transcriptional regulator n=1 Tax=Gordonia sp. CPCC 205333 TaxID=3140790 RepID=UPI003AF3F1A8
MANNTYNPQDMDELLSRPTVSVEQAGRLFGISRAHAYAMVRDGSMPAIRLGPRRVRVPSVRLREMLGLADTPSRFNELAAAPLDATESQAQALHRPQPGRRAVGFL